jgi:hypothetical protein
MNPEHGAGREALLSLIEELTSSGWQPSRYEARRLPVAYRGLASAGYSLDTGLFRLRGTAGAEIEPHILRNLRKYAHRDATPGDSDWNWLSVAQHHGLPTRLLDWTHSPYVAMHFATADLSRYDEPGAVWCVDYMAAHRFLPVPLQAEAEASGSGLFTVEMLSRAAGTLEQFDTLRDAEGSSMPVFFEPPSLDDRIANQAAVFSVMTDPRARLGDWLERHPELFRKVVIPAELKWLVRDHLDQANFTERVLFPGLDGLCRWLGRHYGQRPEDR